MKKEKRPNGEWWMQKKRTIEGRTAHDKNQDYYTGPQFRFIEFGFGFVLNEKFTNALAWAWADERRICLIFGEFYYIILFWFSIFSDVVVVYS